MIYSITLRFMTDMYSGASQRKDKIFLQDKHKNSAEQLILKAMGLIGDH